MRKSPLSLILAITFGIGILAGTLSAQEPAKTPAIDPAKKPIKEKVEKNDVFKKWLTEDVEGFITGPERTAFLKLTTDAERENFIAEFWRRRDPTPDTEENEYRDAYYERIAYANEHFSSGIPGRKTDRGKIYIKWGKPDDVESHPSGGAYDKASYEGGGSATTYPFERWFYRHLDGVGDGIEIEFVDQTGSGEYRLASDLNEKIVTMGPPQSTDGNANYLREQDLPFNVIDRNAKLNSAPPVNSLGLGPVGTLTDSALLGSDPINLDMQVDFFRQSDDRVITTFTIQTSNKDLKFESSGGLQNAMVNVYGKLRTITDKSVGSFEDSITTNATTEELITVRNRKSIYQRVVSLPPGKYRADITVRDVRTGKIGVVNMGFDVPRYGGTKLSTSSLVLASTLRQGNSSEIGDRFMIGGTKLVPNLSGVYKQGQPVGVYLQIYNALTDQTTLRPSVDVQYVLLKDGEEVYRQKEDWRGLSDSTERLTLSRILPTENLKPGDYEVKIMTTDLVGRTAIENKGRFTIVP